MHHAAAEALASLSRRCEKPLRRPIPCSPRPRNPVRGLRLALFGGLRFRASGAFCASRSLLRDVPMDPIGTKTGPGVLCREDARGPFSAPATNLRPPASSLQLRFRESGGLSRSPETGPPASRTAGHRSPVAGRWPPLAVRPERSRRACTLLHARPNLLAFNFSTFDF